jgi:hypothetical protein
VIRWLEVAGTIAGAIVALAAVVRLVVQPVHRLIRRLLAVLARVEKAADRHDRIAAEMRALASELRTDVRSLSGAAVRLAVLRDSEIHDVGSRLEDLAAMWSDDSSVLHHELNELRELLTNAS